MHVENYTQQDTYTVNITATTPPLLNTTLGRRMTKWVTTHDSIMQLQIWW